MKKNYDLKSALLALTFALFTVNLFAQPLSGLYTLDNTQPSSATNFTSFTQLATALNANGVSGPVTINVGITSGPYTEQVTFTQATGISATNSVTINGNGRTLTFNSTASGSPHTLLLNGADHMFFHNLQVVGTGPTYALTVHLYNQANFNQFHGCRFTAPMTGTGTGLVPFSLSGSGTSATSIGNSGDGNVVSTCTMSGGYYSTVLAGNSGTPKNIDNVIRNCQVGDFYAYGIYNYYCEKSLIKGNVVERMNRTQFTTTYGIFLNTGSFETVVDGNHIRHLFGATPTAANTAYAIYIQSSHSINKEAVIINNIISDINSNSTIAGIYNPGYTFNIIRHNTIAIDNQTSSSTTVYGIYMSAGPNTIENNIVSVTRTGPGSKYCLYLNSVNNLQVDGNVLNMTSSGGFIGYYAGNVTSFSAWQLVNSSKYDQHSFSADPVFMNPAGMDYTPTNTVINNMGLPLGIGHDFGNATRSMGSPDAGAIEFYNFACGGIPFSNAVSLPQVEVCPGMSLPALIAANVYTYSGITYQWQASPFAIGGFTNIPGANTPNMTFSPNDDTYYSVVITCTNGGGSVTATPALFNVASTTIDNVPYHEGFETLGLNDLPNCSWSASSMTDGKATGSTITYTASNTNGRFPRTGQQFASFFNTPAGAHYFYSNGINLKGGVTYSASLWFVTESIGYTNWTDMSILVGSSQSPAGLQPIVSTNGPAASNIYKNLSDTFQVAADGVYYIAVRGTVNGTGASYLSWDDLTITLPCEVNAPSMLMGPAPSVICAGFPLHLAATGAASYTWNTGDMTSNIAPIAPQVLAPTMVSYVVTGSDLLSGCTSTLAHNVLVNPAPQVLAIANDPVICDGESVTLSGVNADTYSWAHGPSTQAVTVKPGATTTYSVIGTNAYGCYKMAAVQVIVNTKPTVGAQASPAQICSGEITTLTGNGAVSYTWVSSNAGMFVGSPVQASPAASTVYKVTGTDGNGCSNSYDLVIPVDICAGISSNSKTGLRVYPNPANELLHVESTDATNYDVLDVLGKVILRGALEHGKTVIDIQDLPAGMYHLRLNAAQSSQVVNIVKQ